LLEYGRDIALLGSGTVEVQENAEFFNDYLQTTAGELTFQLDGNATLNLGGSVAARATWQIDLAWYLVSNPDVAAAGADAVAHYVRWGRREARLPCEAISLIRLLGLVDPGTVVFTMADVVDGLGRGAAHTRRRDAAQFWRPSRPASSSSDHCQPARSAARTAWFVCDQDRARAALANDGIAGCAQGDRSARRVHRSILDSGSARSDGPRRGSAPATAVPLRARHQCRAEAVAVGRHGFSYMELLHTRRRYIDADALRDAARRVVNATLAARNSSIWGEGTTACASDSKHFVAFDQNLMTEWHVRYGGRGIMIYWHVERGSVCIHSRLRRCSSSEVAAMIEGVLRHDTDMEIERQYVDSHGQSEVAFAFCRLLGFQLLPRLKAIAAQRLYLPEAGVTSNYPNLASILARPIDWTLIEQQYDEMVRYATAMAERMADPETILRRFTRSNIQHPTYKALAELGKAAKTAFLCRYLGEEALRREIHEGLNVVESWNSANGFIFFGKGGEVASNRLDDQEVSVHAENHVRRLSNWLPVRIRCLMRLCRRGSLYAGAAAMNIRASDQSETTANQVTALRAMTIEQLRDFGTNRVTYVKYGQRDGERVFLLFGADGIPFLTADTVEAAIEAAAEQNLSFVTVH
jgi:TnpA family transposase